MRLARRAWCRAYQTAFRIALPILPYFEPQVADTVEKVPELLAKHGVTTALVVAGRITALPGRQYILK